MSRLKNPVEILKLLNKSNCRECGEATCLAFAAVAARGKRPLSECPHLEKDIIERFGGKTKENNTVEQEMEESVEQLKRRIASIDLSAAALRLGAAYSDDKLTIKILGKNFSIDSKGNLSSEIHIHPWLTIPVLSHIIEGAGVPDSGQWVPFRELKNGKTWAPLFGQRCEKPLKKVADTYTDLFADMLHIFNGRQVENHYASDISLVLRPLPKVPILICYWKPEDGLESSLNLFFDSTVEENLRIESLYALCTGLVRMFEKIGLRHG
ncbi:MAG: DUF3786 domain-containing protein [Pseudomonadota bacterium]